MTERTVILATMSDSDDDVPLGHRMPQAMKRPAPKEDSSDSDDDVPLGARMAKPKAKPKSASKPKPKKRKVDNDSDSDDDEPIGSLMKKSGGTKARTPKSQTTPKKDGNSDEPWKAKKGAKKLWTTLEHNGVVFPPPYEPHGVPLVYDGEDVHLLAHEEEVASFSCDERHGLCPEGCLREELEEDLRRCSQWAEQAHQGFQQVRLHENVYVAPRGAGEEEEHFNEEKKRMKAEREAAEEKYCWATIDGR